MKFYLSFLFIFFNFLNSTYIFGQFIAENSHIAINEKLNATTNINTNIDAAFVSSDGYVWVGINHVLNRFNGFRFKEYYCSNNEKGESFSGKILQIIEDKNNNLIIRSHKCLAIYLKEEDTFKVLFSEYEGLNLLSKDAFGEVILLFNDKVCKIKYPEKSTFFKLIPILNFQENFGFTAINWTHENSLYLGNHEGLYSYNFIQKKPIAIIKHPVSTIVAAKDYLLAGTVGFGLYVITKKNQISKVYHFGKQIEAAYDRIEICTKIDSDKFLVCTNNIFYTLNVAKQETYFDEISNNKFHDLSISSAAVDKNQNIWMGTNNGFFKIKLKNLLSFRYKITTPNYVPLTDKVVYLFKDNAKRLWVKPEKDPFFIFDEKNNTFSKTKINGDVFKIYQNKKNAYYTIGGNTFSKFETFDLNPKLIEIKKAKYKLLSALEISPNIWWLGQMKGKIVSAIENNTKNTFDDLLKVINKHLVYQSNIFILLKDKRDNIWIGSRGGGIIKANLKTKKINIYPNISKVIAGIFEDSKGRIWVSSRNNGIYLFPNQSNNFEHYTNKDGLSTNATCAVSENHKGDIFVSTDLGLAKFLPNQLFPFRQYNEVDGIQYVSFTYNCFSKGEDNYMLFGNNYGLYKIKELPEIKIQQSSIDLESITGISDENNFFTEKEKKYVHKSNLLNNTINIPNSKRNLILTFTYKDFFAPYKTRFYYRINTIQPNWKTTGKTKNKVKLIDLPYGNHILEIKCTDRYGRWTVPIKKITISVEKPLFLENWAIIIYATLLFLIIGWLYKLKQNLKYQKFSAINKQEIAVQNNEQMFFFTELFNETTKQLSALSNTLAQSYKDKKPEQIDLYKLYNQTSILNRIVDYINIIQKNNIETFELRIKKGNIFTELEIICNELSQLTILKNLQIKFTCQYSSQEVWFDKVLLEILLLSIINSNRSKNESQIMKIHAEVIKKNQTNSKNKELLYLKCNITFEQQNELELSKKQASTINIELIKKLVQLHQGQLKNTHNQDIILFDILIDKAQFEYNQLPALQKSLTSTQSNEDANIQKNKTNNSFHKLLIIDQDEDILIGLKTTLAEKKYDIATLTNTEEALNLVKTVNFDLIICDLGMPNIDGITILKAIKQNPETSHIPVIILSNQDSTANKVLCLENNADDFIAKPINHEILLLKIQNIITNQTLIKNKFSKDVHVEQIIEEIETRDQQLVNNIKKIILENLGSENLTTEYLAEKLGMSRATFYRKIEKTIGESPSNYIRKIRLHEGKKMIEEGNLKIEEIADKIGFQSPKHFIKAYEIEFNIKL